MGTSGRLSRGRHWSHVHVQCTTPGSGDTTPCSVTGVTLHSLAECRPGLPGTKKNAQKTLRSLVPSPRPGTISDGNTYSL